MTLGTSYYERTYLVELTVEQAEQFGRAAEACGLGVGELLQIAAQDYLDAGPPLPAPKPALKHPPSHKPPRFRPLPRSAELQRERARRNAKLDADKVRQIRAVWDKRPPETDGPAMLAELASKYRVSTSAVRAVVDRKSWADVE